MTSRKMNSRGATLWGAELKEARRKERAREKAREAAIETLRSAKRAEVAAGRAPGPYDEREESLFDDGVTFRFNFADGSTSVVSFSAEEIDAEIAKGGAR